MNPRLSLLISAIASPSPDEEATGDAARRSVEDASFAWPDLLPAAFILAAAIAIGVALRIVVGKIVDRRSEILGRLAGRFAMFVAVSIGLVYALANVGIRIGPLLGALGIGGFALAFALRDTLENLISGVILQVRQPFDYDDTVELGDYAGRVTNIDLRSVSMTRFSGEHVIIPSKDVLQNPIENWTTNPTRRIDVAVGVSYDIDVEDACRLIADALADIDGVLREPAPDCVFSGFGGSTIDLVARVWYDSRGPYFDILRRTAHTVQTTLNDRSVDMPFPTTTVLTNTEEENAAGSHGGGATGSDAEATDPDGSPEDAVADRAVAPTGG